MLAGVPLGGVGVAGAVDGVVEVVPPAPAGAGFVGEVIGAPAVFLVFGMLEPTPVVCAFGMRARAMRVFCMLEPERAS